MRIYVLTQEDAFYIPRMLDHLLAERRDVTGVGIVPGEMQAGSLLRYWQMLGTRAFVKTGVGLAAFKAFEVASRFRPSKRSYSVAGAARRHGVTCERVQKVNDPDFVESMRAREVELIVSIACPQVMKKDLLAVPRLGTINIHGAMLPRYQGLLPSFWVLAKGERDTGVTVHWVDEELDHGEILLQRPVGIDARDTVHTLVRRSKVEVGKQVLVESIAAIERGDPPRVPMDHAQATYFSYPDAASLREFRSRGRRFI